MEAQQQTKAIQHGLFSSTKSQPRVWGYDSIQVVTSREGRGDAARGAAPTRERGAAASRVSH